MLLWIWLLPSFELFPQVNSQEWDRSKGTKALMILGMRTGTLFSKGFFFFFFYFPAQKLIYAIFQPYRIKQKFYYPEITTTNIWPTIPPGISGYTYPSICIICIDIHIDVDIKIIFHKRDHIPMPVLQPAFLLNNMSWLFLIGSATTSA